MLNANKCEVVMVSNTKSRSDVPICTIANHLLAPSLSVKCLGHWWSWDLSSDKAIEEALGKARRCFFFYGAIGAFDGQLNPLSGRAIFEVCVIPVLLYNCENWFLTESLLVKLEAFQAEIGRRILKISPFHSARAVRLALNWPSMATRIFLKKLAFLSRILENPDSISHRTYISLTQSTTERSIKLIEGCSFLDAHLLLKGFVARVKDGSSSIRELKKELLNIDSINLLEECKIHHSTYLAAKIATSTSWLKIWDLALDLGTLAIQLLFKTMTRPVFGSAACSLCQQSISTTFFDHIITHHIPARPPDPHLNEEDIVSALSEETPDISYVIKHFPPSLMSTLNCQQQ